MGLFDAVAQGVAIDVRELFVETLQLFHPLAFGNQRLGADDQHRLELAPSLQLFQDEARLDGLANTDLVCNQQSRTIRLNQLQHGPELIGDEVDPRCVQRIQVLRARVPELSGRQRGVQCVRFHALAYRPQDDRLDLRLVVGRDLATMEDRVARFGIAWKDIEHGPRDVGARPQANDSAFGNATLRLPRLESYFLVLGPRRKLLQHASTLRLRPIQGRLVRAQHAKKSVERVDVSVGVLGTQSAGRQVSPAVPDPLRFLQPVARLLIEVQPIPKGVPVLIEHPQQAGEIQSRQRIHAPLVDQALLLNREPVDDVRLPPVLTKLWQLALKDSSDRGGDISQDLMHRHSDFPPAAAA